MFQPTPYTIPLLLMSLVSLVMAWYVWRHRAGPGIRYLVLLLVAGSFWTFTYVLELAFVDIAAKIWANKFQYIGAWAMLNGIAGFTLYSTGYGRYLRPRYFIFFNILPALAVLIAFTNELHGWFWPTQKLVVLNGMLWLEHPHGVIYRIYVRYVQILFVVILIFLIGNLFRRQLLFRKQVISFIFALIVPLLTSAISELGYRPFGELNTLQISFGLSMIPLAFGVLKLYVGDIMPVARELVMEVMDEGVFVLDVYDRIIDLNEKARTLLPDDEGALVGRVLGLRPLPDGSMTFFTTTAANKASSIKPGTLFVTKDSQTFIFEVRVTHVLNTPEEPQAKIAVLQDVTKQEETSRKLQQLNARLESLVEERTKALYEANERLAAMDTFKSRLLDDISHELRTPITNITLYTDLLERGSSDKAGTYLGVIRKETARLKRLVEGVLTLSRLDIMKTDTELTAVNLTDLLKEIIEEANIEAERKQITLKHHLPDEAMLVWGNTAQLTYMVKELLENAIKYNLPQGHVTVTLRPKRAEACACLQICDSGLGIDPEERPFLFDRFYRGQKVTQSTIPGLGIGLAIVKEIVQIHQGHIQIEANSPQGTAVTVDLPLLTNNMQSATTQNHYVMR